MASEGNGIVWHVAFAGTAAKDLKTLHKSAKKLGLGEAYVSAMRFAFHRMRYNPLAFGELIKKWPKSQLLFHIRIVEPLLFEFAIHEATHNVLIQRIQLLL